MTLLEVITKASVDQETPTRQSNYPIILNSDEILRNLIPQDEDSNQISLLKPVQGWKISETDSEITTLGNDFCKKLKRKMKNPTSFTQDEFLKLLNSFLEKNREKFSLFGKIEPDVKNYTRLMVKKSCILLTPNVSGLILDAFVSLEIWDLVEVLIAEGIVSQSSSSTLIESLVEKKKSDLVCLCIKHFPDAQASDVRTMLKYFLSPPKGASKTMANVRKKWEKQALLAIEKANSLSGESSSLAKEAAVLLMIAYDEFSSAELCMHYLFASPKLDEVTLLYCLSELEGSEMLKLIRYFGKWVKKYLKFPQAACTKAASVLGLRLCEWIPSLECVVQYLGLVLDEQFASLVLYSEFHNELRALEENVKSLAAEARFCCSLASVVENVKLEAERH